MDLGIAGRKAIVCASSKELGRARTGLAGLITGQHFVMDGGVHRGTF